MNSNIILYGLALLAATNGLLHLYLGETTNTILAYCLAVLLAIYAEVYAIRKSEIKRGEKNV